MTEAAAATLAERVEDALRLVIDPEIGYNIVDLGLVYDVAVEADGAARITMTTTTRGCPATDMLRAGVRIRAQGVAGVKDVAIELTYDPPWTPRMMSAEAKAFLGVADDEDD